MITLLLLHPLKQIPVQVWSFENESVIRIGRSSDNHVILYSAVVSRHHVELRRTGEESWEVVNLGTNGTYLDNQRITQVPVIDGAIIRLARSGPNLQIRLGSDALKDLPNALTDNRGIPRSGLPISATDINGEDDESADRESSARAPSFPTVPASPAMSMSPGKLRAIQFSSVVPGNFASTMAATKITRTLATSTTLISPEQCRHLRREGLFCADCGQPLTILQTAGDYQLVQILNQGTIGITYLAWCRGQTLIVKTLNSHWADDPQAHLALEQEADLLGQLNHPRIPHLIDFFAAEGKPHLVMEVMGGQTLAQHINQHGAIPIALAIDWILELCKILEYLQTFSPPVLHRGIQPSRLIYQTQLHAGRIALIGFGAIKAIALQQSIPPDFQPYAAPEQLSPEATPAVDLYALAPTIAYLITGQNPVSFYRNDRFLGSTVPEASPELAVVLDRLTHPEPDQRYPSLSTLMADLQQVASIDP